MPIKITSLLLLATAFCIGIEQPESSHIDIQNIFLREVYEQHISSIYYR